MFFSGFHFSGCPKTNRTACKSSLVHWPPQVITSPFSGFFRASVFFLGAKGIPRPGSAHGTKSGLSQWRVRLKHSSPPPKQRPVSSNRFLRVFPEPGSVPSGKRKPRVPNFCVGQIRKPRSIDRPRSIPRGGGAAQQLRRLGGGLRRQRRGAGAAGRRGGHARHRAQRGRGGASVLLVFGALKSPPQTPPLKSSFFFCGFCWPN